MSGFVRLSVLCLLGLTAATLLIFTQLTRAQQSNLLPPQHPLPVTVRIVFPTAEDSPVAGGLTPIVVEVREKVSERGVFWTERLLIGVEGQVLLDTTQLTGGEYDPVAQEMVYRVLTPWWALGEIGKSGNGEMRETFIWTQAQWVGVPLDEVGNGRRAVPDYREGEAQDVVDVKVDSQGSLFVASRSATSNAQKGTETRAGTSESSKATGRDAKRRPRRSVEALRKEARRRLQLARRMGKAKPGGRTATSSKGKPRTFIKRSGSGGPDATLVVHWNPDVSIDPPSEACSINGSVAGGLTLELHLLRGSNIISVWHEWTEIKEGSAHGGQYVLQSNWWQLPSGSLCAPTPGEGQSLSSFGGYLPSPGFHDSSWTIKARYGWREFVPPYGYGDPQYAEVSITVNFGNLLLKPDATNPVVLAWDPDDPTKRQTLVKMELTDAQRRGGGVRLQVYRLDDPAQERQPLKVIEVPVTVPAALVEIEWDGTDEWGNVVERGVYAYDLVAYDGVYGTSGSDEDKKTSRWLFIDCATDEEGNPILEPEFAGIDDKGTPDDSSDDDLLYHIRRYKLREVGEDSQPLRGASEGWIRLYYVDELQELKKWSIPELLCIEHNANDGLLTSTEGLQHSVLVKVPKDLMKKMGEYRFVISARDSHADREKGHRQKWALERNQTTGYTLDKVRVYYRANANTVRDRAYPFHNVDVRVRAIIWARTWSTVSGQQQESYGAYCGLQYERNTTDNDPNNDWFNNDGHWYATGVGTAPDADGNFTQGDRHDWLENNSLPPRLPQNEVVRQWRWGDLDFTWWQLDLDSDDETTLTPEITQEVNDAMHRYFLYPEYLELDVLDGLSGWGTNNFRPGVGTRRYIVYVRAQERNNVWRTYRSLSPTPGRWRAKSTDHLPDNLNLDDWWSQNCDEPPATVGPTEFPVRISVRNANINEQWVGDANRRSYLQWLTSYLDTPYEWGAHWYGGRSDDTADVTQSQDADDGYGIDCSGLVASAAWWAGYNWGTWEPGTWGLRDNRNYTDVIDDPFAEGALEPGDILVKAGEHVFTVYRVGARRWDPRRQRWNLMIDFLDACADNENVDIHRGISLRTRTDDGYVARRLHQRGE